MLLSRLLYLRFCLVLVGVISGWFGRYAFWVWGGWLLFDSWCCGIGLRRVSVFGLGGLVWLVACCDAFCCVGLGLIVVLGGCSGVFRVVGWV